MAAVWRASGRRADPARPPRSPSSLDSIVVASGAGLRKLAGCPGYIAPLAAALKRTVPSDSAPDRACTHKIAIGDSDLINVRFGSLCGLKSDISGGPRSAKALNRCAIARCGMGSSASAIIRVEIVDSGGGALS